MADEKIEKAETVEETAEKTSDKAEKAVKESKDAKTEKAGKKKGPGIRTRMGKYFRDLRGEFKKIIWPTVPTVVRNTVVTLAMCAIMGLVICLFDLGLSALVNLLVSLG